MASQMTRALAGGAAQSPLGNAIEGRQHSDLRPCAQSLSKASATAQARAALLGITVYQVEGDFGPELVATRWALCKRFASVALLEAWLDEFGAGHAAEGVA